MEFFDGGGCCLKNRLGVRSRGVTALGLSLIRGTNGVSLLLSISSKNASWGLGMSTTFDTMEAYLCGPLRAAEATDFSWVRMSAICMYIVTTGDISGRWAECGIIVIITIATISS